MMLHLAVRARVAWLAALTAAVAVAAVGAAPVAAGPVDSDGDGLDDAWELDHFGNITSQDQFGDPDGDGMTNLQEQASVTDPLSFDGPSAPTTVSPACGFEVSSLQTVLVADNAVDPQGTPLYYQFALYSDPGLTIEVAHSVPLVPQGAGATTEWVVGVNLLENTPYFWRVRARDPYVFGPWSAPACSFFVNTVNDPPGIPRINSPAFGAQVSTFTPDLVVDNSTDPDQDTLRYQFQLFADPALSQLVAQTAPAGVLEGAMGTTSWQVVGGNLQEDRFYYWRARAVDPDGLAGAYSATGQFFVTTTNSPPEPPAIISPQNGTVVDRLSPDLVILNADDADLDSVVYDWDVARDVAFQNIVDGGTDAPPIGANSTMFTLSANLIEDTRYCWRVRSDDGQATSNYNIACFLVSTGNDPPSPPTLTRPADGETMSDSRPLYFWAPSTDPEDEPVTYEIEVKDPDGTLVGSVAGISGTITQTSTELAAGSTYSWRARAIDRSGASSAWSPESTFTVAPAAIPDGCCTSDGGCQVGSGGAGVGGSVGIGFAAGLLALVRRRRRVAPAPVHP